MKNRSRRTLGLVALLTTWAAAATVVAQEGEGRDPIAALSIARLDALQIERERNLLEFYESASVEARARAAELLRQAPDPRRTRLSPLPLRVIAEASRALESQVATANESTRDWQDLVDSVEVRVTPGVFASREQGLGEAMTVTLDPLWESSMVREPEGGLEALLIWIAPNGEETVARREPAAVAALEAGFEMYIRAPISTPAMWKLALELRGSFASVRSHTIRVECVANLPELRKRLAAVSAEPRPPHERELAQRIEGLWRHGLRTADGQPLATWIQASLGEVADVRLAPFDLSELQQQGVDCSTCSTWELHSTPVDGAPSPLEETSSEDTSAGKRPQRAFLVLTTRGEHPTDLLAGPVGRAWAEVLATSSVRVLAASLPLEPAGDSLDLRKLAQHLKNREGVAQLIVVARGDAGRSLPGVLLRQPCEDIDGLILSETPAAFADISSALSLPILQIQPARMDSADSEASEEELRQRERIRLAIPDPCASLKAPSLMAAWAAKL